MDEKKIEIRPLAEKRAMINKKLKKLSVQRQCQLLGIHRSGIYYTPSGETPENLYIMRQLDEQYLKTPFYGIKRLTAWLRRQGYEINPKRVKRLMKTVRWQTIYQRPNTSWKNKEHKIYPYLLKVMKIERPNQAWAIDITYIPMPRGFMYLCAIIDLHTRYVVSWSLSNTMTAEWCCQVVADAIEAYGCPEVINSDQGSQFTSDDYIDLLKENQIRISMDGAGRAIDNIFIERLWKSVKYECIYIHAFEDGRQLYNGLNEYFRFYNSERLHESLCYATPWETYKKAA